MQNDNVIRVKPDTLIAMAVMEAEALDMSRLPSLQQMNKEFDPSEAFCKRMEKLMTKTNAKEKLKEGIKKAKKYTLAFTVFCTLFFGALLPAHAVQASIVQTVTEWYDGFTAWLYSDSTYAEVTIPNIDLRYIPKGFSQVETPYMSDAEYLVHYRNSREQDIFVRVVLVEESKLEAVDNEHIDTYSIINDGTEAILQIMYDDAAALSWEKDGLLFKVYGTADVGSIIKIGKNLVISR